MEMLSKIVCFNVFLHSDRKQHASCQDGKLIKLRPRVHLSTIQIDIRWVLDVLLATPPRHMVAEGSVNTQTNSGRKNVRFASISI